MKLKDSVSFIKLLTKKLAVSFTGTLKSPSIKILLNVVMDAKNSLNSAKKIEH